MQEKEKDEGREKEVEEEDEKERTTGTTIAKPQTAKQEEKHSFQIQTETSPLTFR